jgi:hypothetical protein
MQQVNFLGELCNVDLSGKYSNGRQAIELICENGEPMCMATVNVPALALAKDEVIIKNYSENEGILEVLISAGIVKETGETVKMGFVECPIVKLLIQN